MKFSSLLLIVVMVIAVSPALQGQAFRRVLEGPSHAKWTVVRLSETTRTSDSVRFVMWDDDDVSIIIYTTESASPNFGKSAVTIRLEGFFQDTGTYTIPEFAGFWRSGTGSNCPVIKDSGWVRITFIDTVMRHLRGEFRMVVDCDGTDFLVRDGSFEVCGVYLNQYDVGNAVDLPIAFSKKGGNACGPTSLGQALNAFKRSNSEDTISIHTIYGKVMTEKDNYNDNNGLSFAHNNGKAYLQSFGYSPVYRIRGSGGNDATSVLRALDSLLALDYVAITGTKFGEAAYPKKGGGHVVLTLGKTRDGRYIVNDPAGDYFEFPTNTPTKHYRAGSDGGCTTYPLDSALALEYGRWFIAFKYEPTIDPAVLSVRVNLTVDGRNVTTPFILRDGQGRRAGWDDQMNQINEIPGAELMVMPMDETGPGDPDGTDTDTTTYAAALTIVNPDPSYEITADAVESGELAISVVLFGSPDSRMDTVVTRTVAAGEPVVITYTTPQSGVERRSDPVRRLLQLELDRNYFTGETTDGSLRFHLQKSTEVEVTLHDDAGRLVRSIASRMFTGGEHVVDFDTKSLSNGVYFLRVGTAENVGMKKIIVAR